MRNFIMKLIRNRAHRLQRLQRCIFETPRSADFVNFYRLTYTYRLHLIALMSRSFVLREIAATWTLTCVCIEARLAQFNQFIDIFRTQRCQREHWTSESARHRLLSILRRRITDSSSLHGDRKWAGQLYRLGGDRNIRLGHKILPMAMRMFEPRAALAENF